MNATLAPSLITPVSTAPRTDSADSVPACNAPAASPEARLRDELRRVRRANDRWETIVAVVLGMAGTAALAWALSGFLATRPL